MSTVPPFVSFAREPIGEDAFDYMPEPGRGGESLHLYSAHLAQVDACLAVAVRATIEHYATSVGIPVSMDLPEEPGCRSCLLGLLGERLPAGLSLRGEGVGAGEAQGGAVLVPATSVGGYADADILTDRLAEELGGRFDPSAVGYLAGALGVLLENSLEHGDDGSIDPLAALSHQVEEGVLRLAVIDTGTTIESDAEADQRLAEALEYSRREEGALVGLGDQAKLLGIDARITIASGNGRLRWRDGEWSPETAKSVAGTSAIVDVAVGG
jgi:hypothetical protein